MATSTHEETVLYSALQLSEATDRAAYLDRACGDDAQLRRRIESLISAYGEGEFLEFPATGLQETEFFAPVNEQPGTTIGPYKLLEQIGEGGMGLVFMAEQSQPLRRRVALKIIKPGLDTRAVIARFEAERQALALMDHPNIARVYDAGATESGRPYFVMELVRGAPITDYCRDRQLDLRERLELFIEVCQAVQHAHQKGVIHRDLKPTNILVAQSDTKPVPKVIDFGVAKATTQPLTDSTLFTHFAQIIGTPLYMSPEQADLGNQDVDTRSDVYSLGVVLYELLTGTTPFAAERLRSAGADEMRRIIREEEPPKPSTRATTAAGALSTATTKIPTLSQIDVSSLKGDLDSIVMKALDKDRRRRYDSPNALAADLRRYIEHKPVVAKPNSSLNKLMKWSRRHVAAVWTAFAVSLAAAILLGVSTVLVAQSRDELDAQRVVATNERNNAVEQRNVAVDERNNARLNEYYAEIVSSQIDLEQSNIPRLHQKLVRHLPLDNEADRRGWEWHYLFSHCHPEQRSIYFPSYVLCAAWSPDGKLIGAGGAIWQADSGKCIRMFTPTLAGVFDCAWSPDSNHFAWGTLTGNGAIYIWNRQNDEVRVVHGHTGSIWPLAFSPDGTQLASGSIDQTVKLWDVATGAIVRTITPEQGGNVTSVVWSPDGSLLGVGNSWGGGVQIYSVTSGDLVHATDIPNSNRTRLSWRPDGTQLAVNSSNRWMLLDCSDWSKIFEHEHPFGSSSDSIGVDIQWSPDGTKLAYAERSIATIWDPATDKQLHRLAGHLEPIQTISWRPDGRGLLTTDRTNDIRIWALDSPGSLPTVSIDGALQRLEWEADNSTLLSIKASDLSARFWDTASGLQVKEEANAAKSNGGYKVLGPDRRLVARPSDDRNDHEILVQNSQTGAIEAVYRCEKPFTALAMGGPDRSFEWKQEDIGWSPDGSKLAISIVSEEELGVDVWDVRQERRISRWSRPRVKNPFGWGDAECSFPTWSPDGKYVAVIGIGDAGDAGGQVWLSRVHVIETATGKRVLKHAIGKKSKDGGDLKAMAWSPDSRFIAIANVEGMINVADVMSGKRVMSCKAHDVPIRALAWSPDGTRLATAAADGVVKLLEPRRGNELLSLHFDGEAPEQLAWSPNGQRLAAASHETIQIWDASRGFAFAEGGSRRRELSSTVYDLAISDPAANAGAFARVLELAPKTLDYRMLRGNAYARMGKFDEAAREFEAARPDKLELGFLVAHRQMYALLGARDLDAYRELLANLIEGDRKNPVDYHRQEILWLGCLIPHASVGREATTNGLNALEISAPDGLAGLDSLQTGAALYRLERYAECAEALTPFAAKLGNANSPPDQFAQAVSHYFLAMAREKLGHKLQADRLLHEAVAVQKQLQTDPTVHWTSLVTLNALKREAEGTVIP